jgi:hypothetical protein
MIHPPLLTTAVAIGDAAVNIPWGILVAVIVAVIGFAGSVAGAILAYRASRAATAMTTQTAAQTATLGSMDLRLQATLDGKDALIDDLPGGRAFDAPSQGDPRVRTAQRPAFWSDVAQRAGRQAVQVLVPILTVAALGGGISHVDFLGVGVAVAVAFLVVVLRALTGLRAPADAPVWVDGLDRALSAASASLLAVVGAANFDALHADWRSVVVAAASSAGLALVAMFTNPPAVRTRPDPWPGIGCRGDASTGSCGGSRSTSRSSPGASPGAPVRGGDLDGVLDARRLTRTGEFRSTECLLAACRDLQPFTVTLPAGRDGPRRPAPGW